MRIYVYDNVFKNILCDFFSCDPMIGPYYRLLLWLVLGVVLGAAVYFVLLVPHATEPSTQVVEPSSPAPALPSPVANETLSNQGQKPILVDVLLIGASGCPQCNSSLLLLQQISDASASFNISVGSVNELKGDSTEAATIISRYKIEKLPVLLLSPSGEPDPSFVSVWTDTIGTQESDGVLVYRNVFPPYYDLRTSSVVGFVNGIAIEAPSCSACFGGSIYLDSLESAGVAFKSKKVLEENDREALALISQYKITRLPSLLLSSDIVAYGFFNDSLRDLGTMENRWFVLRDIVPPYVDLSRNQSVRGLVDAVDLGNSSCTPCFDVAGVSDYLAQAGGIYLSNVTTYEINSTEGQTLVSKYGIDKIPAILYSPEASVYPAFTKGWLTLNSTIEKDGWYVFRAQELIEQPYQNITAAGSGSAPVNQSTQNQTMKLPPQPA